MELLSLAFLLGIYVCVSLGPLRSTHQDRIRHARILLGKMSVIENGEGTGRAGRATRQSCKTDLKGRREGWELGQSIFECRAV